MNPLGAHVDSICIHAVLDGCQKLRSVAIRLAATKVQAGGSGLLGTLKPPNAAPSAHGKCEAR